MIVANTFDYITSNLFIIYFSLSCAIENPETNTVVISGGYLTNSTMTTVSIYGIQGWMEDLKSLNTGRCSHACSSYMSGAIRVR